VCLVVRLHLVCGFGNSSCHTPVGYFGNEYADHVNVCVLCGEKNFAQK
jgi:hypothetical protein